MKIESYDEALQWIHSRLKFGIKPGLKRMEWMLEKLNNPERRIRVIHIGGTNGKGSTTTYFRSILNEAGYEVGSFTSPFFDRFNERISINGTPISDGELIELTNIIKPLCEELDSTELGGPTEFEVITAMAIYYFAYINRVDIALFEVGLGGRLDSTNVLNPILTVITNIGKDHTNLLGETIAEIASEKAGIVKSGVPLISAVKQPEALKVIEEKVREGRASLYLLGKEFHVNNHKPMETGEGFSVETIFQSFDNLKISMMGRHQTENAALAVMGALYLSKLYAFYIKEEHIRTGLEKAYWPGRFEIVSNAPLVLIDGAHNEEGMEALANELSARYSTKKIKAVFAALHDKKLDGMLRRLDGITEQITFTDFEYPRAAKAEELYGISHAKEKKVVHDWQEAIRKVIQDLTAEEMLVITGSLYFISRVKPWLIEYLKTTAK